jgi:nucleotide-binding universal stress UspA family protein
MFGRILLAVDCWPESRAAVSAARDIACASQAEVLVLHVRERERARGVVWEPGLPGDAQELVDLNVYQLARLGLRVRRIDRMALVGRVPEAIVDVAIEERVDLIVIGTRGLSCVRGLFSGSVGHRLIRLAEQPVLIARPTRHDDFRQTSRKHAASQHAK